MQLTGILLLLGCSLACFSLGQAEDNCCRTSQDLLFAVDGGACGWAGGYSTDKGCKITICADGKAKMGKYCGECDDNGCNCKNGCIQGNWQQSFLDNNKGLNAKVFVTSATWNN